MADIFVSYAEEDGRFVGELAKLLESKGYTTWLYERDNLAGVSYLLQTSRAIENSKSFLVVISRQSLESNQMTKEIVRAHEAGRSFVPILLDINHSELQRRQPEWREALGSATAIKVSRKDATAILPRLVRGLEALGVHPAAVDSDRPEPSSPEGKMSPKFSAEQRTEPQRRGTNRRKPLWISGVIVVALIASVVGVALMKQRSREKPATVSQTHSTPPVTAPGTTIPADAGRRGEEHREPPLRAPSNSESVSKEKVLRVLDRYTIGIYFLKGSSRLTEFGRDVQDHLLQYGLRRWQIQLNSRDISFFEEVVPPDGLEIRYEPGREEDAADALRAILEEVFPSKAFIKVATGAGRTDDFISLFLSDEAIASSGPADAVAKNWSGTWQTLCAGKHGPLQGTLVLSPASTGDLQGRYDHSGSTVTIQGTVHASAESSPVKLIGSWKNESGDQGRFVFELSHDGRSFEGRYSMSEGLPAQDSPNWWRGVRTPARQQTSPQSDR